MSDDLPDGWERTTLASLAEVRLGRQRSPKRAEGDHMCRYLRAANVTWSGLDLSDVKEMDFTPREQETYRLRPGDVLMSEASGSVAEVGKPAIWNDEIPGACFQNTLIRVRPHNAELSRYLYWHLMTDARLGRFAQSAPGVGIHHLGAARASVWPVNLAPASQRTAIVDEIEKHLSRIDAGVAALERVQANLKRYRASVLKAACEGRLVPTEAELARREGRDYEPASVLLQRILTERRKRWEEAELAKMTASGKPPKNDAWKHKYQEPAPPDTSELPEIPEGWCWASVEQLGEAVTGTTPSTKREDYYGGTTPFIKPSDLEAGYEVRGARDHLTEAGAAHGRPLPPGAVLVTCIGATIGKAGLARVPCVTNQQINALVPANGTPLSEWVYWVFVAPWGQESIKASASATTLPILNKSKFERLALPLPPESEQRRVVLEVERRLSIAAVTAELTLATRRRASGLRRSILQAAFSGQLLPQT